MRINLTKKEIINSIYMQITKKISENLLEDFLSILLEEIIKNKKLKYQNLELLHCDIKKVELVEITNH